MKKRLTKYDPKAVEQYKFYVSTGKHVIIECWNIEFDNLLEIGIIKRYNEKDEVRLKVTI